MYNIISLDSYKKVKPKQFHKTSKRLGNVGEAVALSKFISLGYNVYLPFGNSGSVDMIVDLNGFYCKVQVKTSTRNNGDAVIFHLTKGNGYVRDGSTLIARHDKYETGEIDAYVLYDAIADTLFMVPGSWCVNGTVKLRYKKAKNPVKSCKYASDYSIEKYLEDYKSVSKA